MKSGNRGLNFTAKLSVEEAIKEAKRLKKELLDMGIATSAAFDKKPMTEYQAEQIRIRQENLEFQKQKAAEVRADKQAALATQAALREESRLRREAIAAAKEQAKVKRTVDMGDSQAEVDAYLASKNAGAGRVASSGRDEYIRLLNEDLEKGKISIGEYKAEMDRLNTTQQKVVKTTRALTLSKKELDQIAAQEKYNNDQNSKALRNNIREMNAAFGSIEQRRAALIRLAATYDNLSVAERKSDSGQRLQRLIAGRTEQLKVLEAETGRAQRNVGNYTSAFSKGLGSVWNGLKQVANILPGLGIAGLLAFAIDPIVSYLSKLDLFKKKATEAKLAQENVAKALAGSEYAKAVTNVNELRINIDLAKKGLISKESVLKQYNDTIGKTTGSVNSLDKAEQDLKKNAAAFIEVTLLKAAAQIALEDAAKRSYEAEISRRKKLEEFDDQFLDASVSNVRSEGQFRANQQNIINQRKKRQEEEIQISEKAAEKQKEIARKFQEDAANISKKNGFINFLGNNDPSAMVKQIESFLSAQRALQAKIDEMNNSARRNQKSAEESEVQAVREKYAKLLEEARLFNEKVAKYNSDPKNTIKRKGVNTSGLQSSQQIEITTIEYKAETGRIKAFLDEQQALYAKYEEYKLQYGLEKANERYSRELDISSNYMSDLQQREAELLSKGSLNPLEQERLRAIQERIEKEEELERVKNDKLYAEAFQAAQTHFQKAIEIEQDYQRKRKALGDTATKEQLENLEREKNTRIRENNSANAYAKSGYEELLMNIDAMSSAQAIKALDRAIAIYDQQYKQGLISAKEYYDRIAELENQKKNVNGTQNNPFARITESVKAYRKQLASADKDSVATEKAQKEMFASISAGALEASQAVGVIAGSLDELGIGGQALQDALKNVGGILDGASGIASGIATGNPIDIVTGSVKLLTSAIQLFNTKDKKLQKQIDGYKANLESLEQSYAKLDRAVQNSVGESYYADSAKQIDNLKKQQAELIKMRNAESSKKKADQDKIKDYNNQINDIPNKIADIEKAISVNLIQGSFKELSSSLADALTGAFQAGEDGLAAMDKSFNQFIGNAIKNSLKLKLIEPIVAGLTEDLVAYAKGNNNSIVGFNFADYKKQLDEAGKLFNQGLEQSKQFFQDTADASKQGELSKGIQGITETTANRLEAELGGLRLTQLQTNALLTPIGKSLGDLYLIARDNFAVQQQIEKNTYRTANNTNPIPQIVDELRELNRKIANVDAIRRGAGL